jgi:1,2-diacylglycerol 3-alpha-glucosyltransferase
MPRIVIQFARFGPYHLARLRSAGEALRPMGWEVFGLETAGRDVTYAWEARDPAEGRIETVFPDRNHEEIPRGEMRRGFFRMLERLRPDAVAIAGWAGADAMACLDWCRRNRRKAILMSETREADGKRVWWKERVKSWRVRRFDGALVGGQAHKDYLVRLGMVAGKIRSGYNAVDNDFFAEQAGGWRERHRQACAAEQERELRPYFLASNRFVARKNLLRLVEAYRDYAADCGGEGPDGGQPWPLVLLGDGEQRGDLLRCCREFGFHVFEKAPWENPSPAPGGVPTVYFPGFRQIDELPRFYAHAGCFVHPALEEPWGLVINEAMAAGLPILAGENVGAAQELVEAGKNGWLFNAEEAIAMAASMKKIATMPAEALEKLSLGSRATIENRMPLSRYGMELAKLV